jgi:hypothetical protein
MNKVKKTYLFFALMMMISFNAFHVRAQDNDFGTWLGANISKDLTKKISLEFEEEVRIFNNFKEIDRFATGINGVYSLNKFLKSGLGYDWIYNHNVKKSFWENRHRYYAYVTGKVELGRFTLSLRERFQSTFYDLFIHDKESDYSPHNYLRSRFEIDYDIKGSKLEPYISSEIHYQLNNPGGNEIDNWRYTAGLGFPLSKKINLDTYLRLNQDVNVKNPVNLWLLGINLSWKL